MTDQGTCNPHWHKRYSNALLSGYIGLYLILCRMHKNCNGSPKKIFTLKHWQQGIKLPPQTAQSRSLRCVAEEFSTPRNATLKRTGQNHESISPGESGHEILPRTSSRYRPLEIRSGNSTEMLVKYHLYIKCHQQNIKVYRLVQNSSAES